MHHILTEERDTVFVVEWLVYVLGDSESKETLKVAPGKDEWKFECVWMGRLGQERSARFLSVFGTQLSLFFLNFVMCFF